METLDTPFFLWKKQMKKSRVEKVDNETRKRKRNEEVEDDEIVINNDEEIEESQPEVSKKKQKKSSPTAIVKYKYCISDDCIIM